MPKSDGGDQSRPGYVWAPYVPLAVTQSFDDSGAVIAPGHPGTRWSTSFPRGCPIGVGSPFTVSTVALSWFGALRKLNGAAGVTVAWDDWSAPGHAGCKHPKLGGEVLALVGESLVAIELSHVVGWR